MISGNRSRLSGGGIYCKNSAPVIGGTAGEGNTFSGNISADGTDLACLGVPGTPITASYNTFSGNPDSGYYVSPNAAFDLTGSTAELALITTDVYVSPTGDDTGDGLSWGTAFLTIQHALSQVLGTELNPVTVHLDTGEFSETATGEPFPLPMLSYVSVAGAGWDNTVIDTGSAGSAFIGYYDDNFTLSGMHLTGSIGSGIYCNYASPVISACRIQGFGSNAEGSGIYCSNSSPVMDGCEIIGNSAGTRGGGILCQNNGTPVITNCVITGNSTSGYGGGIACRNNANAIISNCTFTGNTALIKGGGLYVENASPVVSGAAGLENVFDGNHAPVGGDMAANMVMTTPVNAAANTFSGYHLSDYYVSPQASFDLTGSTSGLAPVTQDVYVATDGNDGNNGLSPATAFRTLNHAFSQVYATEMIPLTVYVGTGTFSTVLTGEIYPLPLLSYVSVAGDGMDTTILDASGSTGVFRGSDDDNLTLTEMTLTGSSKSAIEITRGSPMISACRFTGISSGTSGSGISCTYASPAIFLCEFTGNSTSQYGGAINAGNSASPVISNCTVTGNWARRGGGGIVCGYASSVTISDCVLADNASDDSGGGILVHYGYAGINGCLLTGNTARRGGGGIKCVASNPVIGGTGDGNYFTGNRAPFGSDITTGSIPVTPIDATGNTFAGYHLSDYYVAPGIAFDLTNCSSEMTPITQDIFVRVDGSNENDGLTWETAYATIQFALSRVYASDTLPVTIQLGPGEFSDSSTSETFPLPLVSHVTLMGSGTGATTLNSESTESALMGFFDTGSVVADLAVTGSEGPGIHLTESSPEIADCLITGFHNNVNGGGMLCDTSSPIVTGCTFRLNTSGANGGGLYAGYDSSPIIDDCLFDENEADNAGGGFYSLYSTPRITGSVFLNNRADTGGGVHFRYDNASEISDCEIIGNISAAGGAGIFIRNSTATVTDCLIRDNLSDGFREISGGGIFVRDADVTVTNCTITGNTAFGVSKITGGGLHVEFRSDVIVRNTILWNNQALSGTELSLGDRLFPSTLIVEYSDVQGGETGVDITPGSTLIWGDGNLDADPLFVTGPDGDFYLSHLGSGQPADSPCTDAGNAAADTVCYTGFEDTVCLSSKTTRTDGAADTGIVDMGKHFPEIPATPTPEPTATSSVTPEPTDTPTTTPSQTPTLTSTPTMTATPSPTPSATEPPTHTPEPPTATPTPPDTCPDSSIFGQEPMGPEEPFTSYRSDQTNLILVYDNLVNFSGGPVFGLRWWGFDLVDDTGFPEGSKDVDFEITFYDNDAGIPGNLITMETVHPHKTETGVLYMEYAMLNRYECLFDTAVQVPADAWISIRALYDPGNPDVVFFWLSSIAGDLMSLQHYGGTFHDLDLDTAFCLLGESAVTPTPVPTVTPEPTAYPPGLSLSITMPSHYFPDGSYCTCWVGTKNYTLQDYPGVLLFVVLEVYGTYYFYPSYGPDIDFLMVDLWRGHTQGWRVLDLFIDEDWTPINNLVWYAAILNSSGRLITPIDIWIWGFGTDE